MLPRLRHLLTALVVGTAIFVMHVELVGAASESAPHAAAAIESVDHPEHCAGDCHGPQHQSHLLLACSMTLIVLGMALVLRRVRRRSVDWPAAAPTSTFSARAPTIVALARPPDLAALAVMRC